MEAGTGKPEITVLRIENAAGWGPFNAQHHGNGREVHAAVDLAYEADIPPPGHQQREPELSLLWRDVADGAAGREQFRFGFKDRAQLRLHFTPAITKALRLLGFKVRYYRVKDIEGAVLWGRAQVAFHQHFARRIR